MNPRILERIALHADMDTRRALGIPPGKLPKTNFRVPANPSWKYYTEKRLLVFFNVNPEYGAYEFDVHTNAVYDATADTWHYEYPSCNRTVFKGRLRNYKHTEHPLRTDINFSFAEMPEFIYENSR